MSEAHKGRAASPSAPSRPFPSKRTRSDDQSIPKDTSAASSAATASSSSKVLEAFGSFRDEIDTHNDRRERLIKSSRDVTALSKKVIFLLHRFDVNDFASAQQSSKTQKLFAEAETKLQEIVSLLRQAALSEGLGSLDSPVDQVDASTKRLRAQRYERNIGGGLEEFIEAISFYHYLRTTRLITLQQIQARFLADPVPESHFYSQQSDPTQTSPPTSQDSHALHVPVHRYLLGLSDLTGELMRFATNAVGQGDTGSVVKQVLSLTRQLRDALDPFVPLVRDLKKKQTVTNQSLRKIEDILYAITVRSAEFSSDPQALREMVRRSLATSSEPNARDEDG
ncbi:Translin [Pseudozyma hubeiensis]|nr:Translin [Pseudozyma hubeiensis]